MTAKRRSARSLPWLMLPLLTACLSGFNSNQVPQQTYVLKLPSAATAAEPSGTQAEPRGTAVATESLEVLLPSAAAGLSGDGIAVLRPGERLDYYTGARWAAAAPALLQTLVIETLRRHGHFALVESDSGPFDAAYLLSLELAHFEAEYQASGPPTVRVELVCALGRRSGRHVLESFTATGSATASADQMGAVVSAFEEAPNAALAQIGARLQPPAAAAANTAP
jgi:cholesterol transport system auxiliary component